MFSRPSKVCKTLKLSPYPLSFPSTIACVHTDILPNSERLQTESCLQTLLVKQTFS